jgi:hypothetical protein
MSQQMNFSEVNRQEPSSYATGYEEISHDSAYASPSFGQKLSGQETGKTPTAGQRLALAIVSILAFLLMFFVVIVLAFANLSPVVIGNLAPVLGIMSLVFFVAIIWLNIVFNRRR